MLLPHPREQETLLGSEGPVRPGLCGDSTSKPQSPSPAHEGSVQGSPGPVLPGVALRPVLCDTAWGKVTPATSPGWLWAWLSCADLDSRAGGHAQPTRKGCDLCLACGQEGGSLRQSAQTDPGSRIAHVWGLSWRLNLSF